MFDNFSVDAYLGHQMFDAQIDEGIVCKFAGMGHFHVEWMRPDSNGVLQHHKTLDFHNGITAAGLNYLLNVGFDDSTQEATWYLFPISNVGFTGLSSADTMNSHAGWAESTAYSESNRPQWTNGPASAGSMTNSTQVVMTINADGTALVGLGLASSNVKADTSTSDILWATGLFGSVQNMNDGDVLKITYSITLTATN